MVNDEFLRVDQCPHEIAKSGAERRGLFDVTPGTLGFLFSGKAADRTQIRVTNRFVQFFGIERLFCGFRGYGRFGRSFILFC